MSGFNVQLKIDPSQALGAAKTVGVELDKVEAKGETAGAAVGEAFDKASVKGQKAIAAAKQLAAAMGAVGNAIRAEMLGAVGRAVSQLSSHFEREANILRSLRGPMEDYKADLAAIGMLHKRGIINAREYGQALAAARQGLGGGSVTSNIDNRTGKTIGAASGIGDKLSGAMTAAAPYMAGAYAGKQVLDLADAHTSLTNRLEASTGAARRNNRETMTSAALYDRLHDVAQDTRTSIDATTTSYLGLASATSKLGLSQDQTIRMTETINKLTANADSQQRDAGLRQLGQALSSGRLQGDEFKSIAENLSPLRDAIADALGVGNDKLREMASEGKLTSKVLVEAFTKMGDAADAAFASSKASYSDRLTQLKNFGIKVAPDAIASASGAGIWEKVLRDRLDQLEADAKYQKANRDAAGPGNINRNAGAFFGARVDVSVSTHDAARALETWNLALGKFRTELALVQPATVRAADAVRDYKAAFADARAEEEAARKVLAMTIPGMNDVEHADRGLVPPSAAKLNEIAARYKTKRIEMPGAATGLGIEEQLERTRELIRQNDTALKEHALTKQSHALASKQLHEQLLALTGGVDYYKRVLDDIFQPQKDFVGSTNALHSMLASGVITLQQYNEQFRKLSENYDKSGFAKLWNDVVTNPGGFRPAQVQGDDGKMRDPDMDEYNAQRRAYDLSRHDRAANAALGELERSAMGDPVDTSPNLDADLAANDKRQAAIEEQKRSLLEVSSIIESWRETTVIAKSDIESAWDSMAAKATDVAGAMESVFTSAYQGIEDALTQLIVHQKLDMQSFVDMMLEQMARLAIRSAISGIAGAVGGGGGGGTVSGADLATLIMDPTWGNGSSARVAQPTSPTIVPANSNGVSARQSGGPTTIIVPQDPNGLLPALERPGGVRTVARIAVREAGPALSRRPRYGG